MSDVFTPEQEARIQQMIEQELAKIAERRSTDALASFKAGVEEGKRNG